MLRIGPRPCGRRLFCRLACCPRSACRAGVHARRRETLRGRPACGRQPCFPCPVGRGQDPALQIVVFLAATRQDIGRARRQCTPPSSPAGDATSGLRCPHRAARAAARLHSATAAPAPSRCIRAQAALDFAAPCRGGFQGGGHPSHPSVRAYRAASSPCRGAFLNRPQPCPIFVGADACIGPPRNLAQPPVNRQHRQPSRAAGSRPRPTNQVFLCNDPKGYRPHKAAMHPSVIA